MDYLRDGNGDAILPKTAVLAVQHTGSLGEGVGVLTGVLRVGHVEELVLLFVINTKRRALPPDEPGCAAD